MLWEMKEEEEEEARTRKPWGRQRAGGGSLPRGAPRVNAEGCLVPCKTRPYSAPPLRGSWDSLWGPLSRSGPPAQHREPVPQPPLPHHGGPDLCPRGPLAQSLGEPSISFPRPEDQHPGVTLQGLWWIPAPSPPRAGVPSAWGSPQAAWPPASLWDCDRSPSCDVRMGPQTPSLPRSLPEARSVRSRVWNSGHILAVRTSVQIKAYPDANRPALSLSGPPGTPLGHTWVGVRLPRCVCFPPRALVAGL